MKHIRMGFLQVHMEIRFTIRLLTPTKSFALWKIPKSGKTHINEMTPLVRGGGGLIYELLGVHVFNYPSLYINAAVALRPTNSLVAPMHLNIFIPPRWTKFLDGVVIHHLAFHMTNWRHGEPRNLAAAQCKSILKTLHGAWKINFWWLTFRVVI